jgi:hypothetical protein
MDLPPAVYVTAAGVRPVPSAGDYLADLALEVPVAAAAVVRLPFLGADCPHGQRERKVGGGLRHSLSPSMSAPLTGLIARLLRGYSKGPVKTGPELQ